MKKNDGVWIPVDAFSLGLNANQTLMLYKIYMLDGDKGCFATNKYFADFFKLSKRQVSTTISALVKEGFLRQSYEYADGTKSIKYRILRPSRRSLPYSSEVVTKAPTKNSSTINKEVNKELNKTPKTKVSWGYLNCVQEYYEQQQTLTDIKPNRLYNTNKDRAIQNGIKTIKSLIEIDGYKMSEIKNALGWAIKNEFWKDKIISLSELRKKASGSDEHKFDNLYKASQRKSKEELEQIRIDREDKLRIEKQIKDKEDLKRASEVAEDSGDMLGDFLKMRAKSHLKKKVA